MSENSLEWQLVRPHSSSNTLSVMFLFFAFGHCIQFIYLKNTYEEDHRQLYAMEKREKYKDRSWYFKLHFLENFNTLLINSNKQYYKTFQEMSQNQMWNSGRVQSCWDVCVDVTTWCDGMWKELTFSDKSHHKRVIKSKQKELSIFWKQILGCNKRRMGLVLEPAVLVILPSYVWLIRFSSC